MSAWAVVLAGVLDCAWPERVRQALVGRRLVAADGGMEHLVRLGLEPDMWLGDFDSGHFWLQMYPHVQSLRYPTHKDKTDGDLAIAYALEQGATDIMLIGALGGRSDHALFHYLKLMELAAQGVACHIWAPEECVYPLVSGQTLKLQAPIDSTFSVVPFEQLLGLSIEGALWNTDRIDVLPASSWTLSNAVRAPRIELSLKQGKALVALQSQV